MMRGWYGAAEKADTFFFEHDWVPVPGHPAEVATCQICGLNRWSDEHMTQAAAANKQPYGDVAYADPGYQADKKKRYPIDTEEHVRAAWSYINQAGNAAKYSPADRERIKSRIKSAATKFGVNIAEESAAQLERLQRSYGPAPVAPMHHTPEMVAPSHVPDANDPEGQEARAVEDKAIAESAKSPAAQQPHPMMPAQYPQDDGQPRCRLCGNATPAHAGFQPETPIVAGAPLTIPTSTTFAPWAVGGGGSTGITMNFSGADFSATDLGTMATTMNRYVPSQIVLPTATEVRERLAPVVKEGEQPEVPAEKAFITEVNGKTLLTGRASAFNLETAMAGNEHMLWLQGRFVGAEKANRNGSLWSTGDLEMGQASVNHGPLNWLHEARHVIGTIASAELVNRNEQAGENLAHPYIQATSAIWRWIYPDEAWVVEQASDAGKLWYSMECISKNVECVGDGSCAAKASYGDYLQNKGCEHMTQRSATRRFEDPTFLGGAVIVPPVRPGWAEADLRVQRQAAQLAEHAFDQAGRPDVQATEWEQLMAQLVRFAG